jgi:hypothetical protein
VVCVYHDSLDEAKENGQGIKSGRYPGRGMRKDKLRQNDTNDEERLLVVAPMTRTPHGARASARDKNGACTASAT